MEILALSEISSIGLGLKELDLRLTLGLSLHLISNQGEGVRLKKVTLSQSLWLFLVQLILSVGHSLDKDQNNILFV